MDQLVSRPGREKDIPHTAWFQSFQEKYLGPHTNSASSFKQNLQYIAESDVFESETADVGALPLHPDLAHVDIRLSPQSKDSMLWYKLYEYTNEMMVTSLGRNIYPKLVLQVRNMVRLAKYHLLVEIIPADRNRYTYIFKNSAWAKIVKKERHYTQPARRHFHPDSPMLGESWMEKEVEFSKIKLTNKLPEGSDDQKLDVHSILEPMQYYQVKVTAVLSEPTACARKVQLCKSFLLPETKFLAVTTYNNPSVKRIKIDNNPYATGFRGQEQRDWDEYNSEMQKRLVKHEDKYTDYQQQPTDLSSESSSVMAARQGQGRLPECFTDSNLHGSYANNIEGGHYLSPSMEVAEQYYNGYSVYQQPAAHVRPNQAGWSVTQPSHQTLQYNIPQPHNYVNSVTYYAL